MATTSHRGPVFVDVPMAELVAPPLTTISMPTQEAGAAAVRLLGGEPATVELSGTLVIRGSTGPRR